MAPYLLFSYYRSRRVHVDESPGGDVRPSIAGTANGDKSDGVWSRIKTKCWEKSEAQQNGEVGEAVTHWEVLCETRFDYSTTPLS
jgi:hypothetical protein